MIRSNPMRWPAALCSLCLLGLTATGATAAAPIQPAGGLVVHEWGTFSTFSGSDGVYQRFHVNGNDLPSFVHKSRIWDDTKGGRGAILVSLETPVLYFYSDQEINASVRVDFPQGFISEWYPEASRPPDRKLQWDNIKVFPRGRDVSVATDKEMPKSRYYVARDVDASPVQIKTKKDKLEHEKFLFYRGVGDFQMPLLVQAHNSDNFTVMNKGTQPIPAAIFVHVHDRKIRFQKYSALTSDTKHSALLPEASLSDLVETMVKLLIEQGLYEKEARAMVKTWQADWFGDEGTRVLYIVPPAVADAFLPIRVTPKPESLVRVLVGRHDVLTPDQERKLDSLNKKSPEYQKVVEKLGRYRGAALNASYERTHKTKEK